MRKKLFKAVTFRFFNNYTMLTRPKGRNFLGGRIFPISGEEFYIIGD